MSDGKETNRRVSRFAAVFAGGTMLSRALGLVRDMVIGGLVPDASRDAFLFAFRFPNMLRDMLGEGAANAAFVPVFAEAREKDSEAKYRELVSACLSAMILLFGALTVIGLLLIPWVPAIIEALRPLTRAEPKDAEQLRLTVRLIYWTFPYLFFIGLAVFAMGPLFVARHYGTPSWSPVLLNLALIATCLGLRDWFPDPAWALVTGVWLGGVAQWAAMWLAMKRHTGVLLPNFQLGHPGIRRAAWLLGPVILGQAAGEVNKLVDGFFAYSLSDGVVSALFYANRLVQLPLSVFGVAVAVAILPDISRAAARRDDLAIRETLLHGYRQSFFLAAPAMLGLLALGRPIVRLLFERGHFGEEMTNMTSISLFYYGLGILSFVWVKISVQGFYAEQNTRTPVIIASASMVLNILLNCALVGLLGYRGLAIATTLSFTVNFLLLYVFLCNRHGLLWDAATASALGRTTLAALIATAAAYGLWTRIALLTTGASLWAQCLAVGTAIMGACLVYLGLCKSLKIKELNYFMEMFDRRHASR
ncbi:MAG TPA: murein biosynthesis integral membrane protein MurJ [Candidatus Hydrogenedentes bacterium]|nr:murein biosynthesis integral membrane protein MurJ [Candidatus Hydrogenedentota bacterium]